MIRINKAEYKYLKKYFKQDMFTKTVHNIYTCEENCILKVLYKIREDGSVYVK